MLSELGKQPQVYLSQVLSNRPLQSNQISCKELENILTTLDSKQLPYDFKRVSDQQKKKAQQSMQVMHSCLLKIASTVRVSEKALKDSEQGKCNKLLRGIATVLYLMVYVINIPSRIPLNMILMGIPFLLLQGWLSKTYVALTVYLGIMEFICSKQFMTWRRVPWLLTKNLLFYWKHGVNGEVDWNTERKKAKKQYEELFMCSCIMKKISPLFFQLVSKYGIFGGFRRIIQMRRYTLAECFPFLDQVDNIQQMNKTGESEPFEVREESEPVEEREESEPFEVREESEPVEEREESEPVEEREESEPVEEREESEPFEVREESEPVEEREESEPVEVREERAINK